MVFTYCQVPVVYEKSDQSFVKVDLANGEQVSMQGTSLDGKLSQIVFQRSGEVKKIHVAVAQSALK